MCLVTTSTLAPAEPAAADFLTAGTDFRVHFVILLLHDTGFRVRDFSVNVFWPWSIPYTFSGTKPGAVCAA